MSPLLLCLVCTVSAVAAAELQPGYYSKTCPQAENIVRDVLKKAVIRDPRNPASILRFQFHDCFVDGCDASVLLDDTPTILGEKEAIGNRNSLRAFEVFDDIKEALEKACPGIVSCADMITIAARDAVELTGGPSWTVKLGRKDSLTAVQEHSNKILPSQSINGSTLVDIFTKFKLSPKDLVALSGAHTLGKGSCGAISDRLYNHYGSGKPDPEINPIFREKLEKLCPLGDALNVTGDLDSTTRVFDNQFFKDLVARKGFLNSDQTLNTTPETREYVVQFSKDQDEFFRAFVEAMIKLADLQSGNPGEVRRNCRRVNDNLASVVDSGDSLSSQR